LPAISLFALTLSPSVAAPSTVSPQFDRIARKAQEQRRIGNTIGAEKLYLQAYRLALSAKNRERSGKALLGLGACQLQLFRYKSALDSFLKARQLARDCGDKRLIGAATLNLSSLYFQVHDLVAAEDAASDAIKLLQASGPADLLAKALINHGSIELELGRFEAGKKQLQRALSVAMRTGDLELESLAWEYLGESSLNAEKLVDAGSALAHAYQVRDHLPQKKGLSLTLVNMATLDLKLARFQSALNTLDKVLACCSLDLSSIPPYEPIYLRSLILVALRRPDEALSELTRAVRLATEWRRFALPSDTARTQTAVHVDRVFRDYAALAAELALRRHDDRLAMQALSVLSENRAASLREQLALAFQHELRFPPRYYRLVSELQQAQAQATLGKDQHMRTKVAHIRLELAAIENHIGLAVENAGWNPSEDLSADYVKKIQETLTKDDLLLSFSLGRAKSFLWAVTAERVTLFQLPPESDISRQARAFSESVRGGNGSSGQQLAQAIFGQLDPVTLRKANWLIVADSALLDCVPFAALPLPGPSGKHRPLVLDHTLRLVPSERLLLSHVRATPKDEFVGIGDPVYNIADARWLPPHLNGETQIPIVLSRLVGSNDEIRRAAEATGLSNAVILTGRMATRAALARVLSKRPKIIHFAVHVVSTSEHPGEAALALSLTAGNLPELLTSEAVAAYRLPGSLIVLSGCSSEQGQVLSNADVLGLTRAWLLAGASAVVVSAWPTPDNSAEFFVPFYQHFKRDGTATQSIAERAARALKDTQVDMQRSKGPRGLISFWAAYSVVARQ
jgi:CHAT domain-containing protein